MLKISVVMLLIGIFGRFVWHLDDIGFGLGAGASGTGGTGAGATGAGAKNSCCYVAN